MKIHIACQNSDHQSIIAQALALQGIDVIDDVNQADQTVKIDTPARLGTIINRIRQSMDNQQKNQPIELGSFIFTPTIHELTNTQNTKSYQLTEKETAIIMCLHNDHPNAVERSTLLEKVWEYAPDAETHTVETHIYRLRQKIEQDNDENGLIVTTDNGYSLNID